MSGLFLRLLGFRKIESPEAIRITAPRWVIKLFPGVMDEMREKVMRDTEGRLDVRVVERSVIARYR